jgi:hypothetical protein
VVGDADQRIASLEALVRAAGRIPKVDAIVADPEEDGGEPVPSDALGRDLTPEPDGRERQSIYDLADAGKTPVEIAEETGRDTGEVELILALRRGSTPG